MKYAVEAKVFDNGRMVARVWPARDGEERRHSHAGTNNDPPDVETFRRNGSKN